MTLWFERCGSMFSHSQTCTLSKDTGIAEAGEKNGYNGGVGGPMEMDD